MLFYFLKDDGSLGDNKSYVPFLWPKLGSIALVLAFDKREPLTRVRVFGSYIFDSEGLRLSDLEDGDPCLRRVLGYLALYNSINVSIF